MSGMSGNVLPMSSQLNARPEPRQVDLCVIGAGVNGAAIARDAAGRGLSVALIDQSDLGSATSSASSKMIHGGLRYLEQFEFAMVRESLQERSNLLRNAPHLVHGAQFILPLQKISRPAWMIRIGLYLYDYLAKREQLPASKSIKLSAHRAGKVLKPEYQKAFSYSDCVTDDSRLVTLLVMDAEERGAHVFLRNACERLRREQDQWHCQLSDGTELLAKAVINATGPWARQFLEAQGLEQGTSALRLVRGSHIIVDKQYPDDESYLLQEPDGRVVFAWPFGKDHTMIGTTEAEHTAPLSEVAMDEAERDYILKAWNRHFQPQLSSEDIRWAFSGVRPLLDGGDANATKLSREYHLHWHMDAECPPLMTVFGGKLTTHRALAERAVNELLGEMKHERVPCWTATSPLPGGLLRGGDVDAQLAYLLEQYPWLPPELGRRYVTSYGSRAERLLEGAESIVDMGENFGAELYERELAYGINHEYVREPEDFLWRRSKLGLLLTEEQQQHLRDRWPELRRKTAAAA